jgi:hypothetical protein
VSKDSAGENRSADQPGGDHPHWPVRLQGLPGEGTNFV